MAESGDRLAGAGDDVELWTPGSSLTVVVPTERVRDFVVILSEGEQGFLFDVMSANGIQINFRPENDWTYESESGTGWIQLVIDRTDVHPDDFHVLAKTMTRAEARKVGAGLSGQAPALVPLTMNYLEEGVEAIAEVAVYFTAESVPTKMVAAEVATPEGAAEQKACDARQAPHRAITSKPPLKGAAQVTSDVGYTN